MEILNNVVLSGGVILGILICLFGFKFQKAIIALIGFVLGLMLGNFIISTFGVSEPGLVLVLKYGLALVMGACSLGLLESLLAIIVGVGIFIVVTNMLGSVWYSYIAGIILGFIGAGFAGKFYKLGVVLITSLVGSYMIANGVGNLFDIGYNMLVCIIFIASFIFQCSTNKIKIF